MVVENIFIEESINKAEIEEFLRRKFKKVDYSRAEIRRTPLGTRIIIWTFKPQLIIGKGGKLLEKLAEEIKEKFKIENPLIDVKEVEEPFLNANIVAARVARAIERGINFKRAAKYYTQRVMEAGATGVQIRIGGKLMGSERSRMQKFREGYIAHSGEYAERLVDEAYAQASIKPGIVGVHVMIMLRTEKEAEVKEFKPENQIKNGKS